MIRQQRKRGFVDFFKGRCHGTADALAIPVDRGGDVLTLARRAPPRWTNTESRKISATDISMPCSNNHGHAEGQEVPIRAPRASSVSCRR